jgi:hypothetical protein
MESGAGPAEAAARLDEESARTEPAVSLVAAKNTPVTRTKPAPIAATL